MNSSRHKLLVCGYLKEALNEEADYGFLIAIIIEYSQQRFAKYFEQRTNQEFITEMRFGDIVRKRNNQIMVLNNKNELLKAGRYNKYTSRHGIEVKVSVYIPASICKRLNNAVSFYSKCNDNVIPSDVLYSKCRISLSLSHNDGFIIDKLGGPLKPEYESIRYHSYNGEFQYIQINYTQNRIKQFDEIDLENWDYKDVIKFHEIRSDINNITKINVTGLWLKKVSFASNLWIHKVQRARAIQYHSHQYIGPKEEESEMIDKITDFYVRELKHIAISILEVEDADLKLYSDQTERGY